MADLDSPQVVPEAGIMPDDRPQSHAKRALEPLLWGAPMEIAEPKSRTVLGLQRRHFYTCVVILLFVIAATVGGSVGGALAVQQARAGSNSRLAADGSPIASSTPSTPSQSGAFYLPPPAGSVREIDTQCGSKAKSWSGSTFSCHAGQNIPGMGDIAAMIAYSIQQCIDACSSMSSITGAPKCRSVALGKMLSHEYGVNKGANCWLKNMTGGNGEMSSNTDYVVLTLDE